MSQWFKVAPLPVLHEGDMIECQAGEQRVVVALVESKLRAFAAHCPHASASLAEGDLRPGYVICPLHAYRFDLKSGTCLKPRDGPRLRVYEVETRGEDIWVRV